MILLNKYIAFLYLCCKTLFDNNVLSTFTNYNILLRREEYITAGGLVKYLKIIESRWVVYKFYNISTI